MGRAIPGLWVSKSHKQGCEEGRDQEAEKRFLSFKVFKEMRWWLKRGEGGGIEDVHDEGVDYDMDAGHLEGDGVEDHDEKNGDENVGAEEQSKQGDGSDAVAEEAMSITFKPKI